jgi:transcriptional activator SPT7
LFKKIYCSPLSTQTTVEALDDEALFRIDEDEEEDGAFVMCVDFLHYYLTSCSTIMFCRGNFADALGDDFLGLRELGIADEFGMSSLSVPKKLLKGKNKEGSKLSAAAYVLTEHYNSHAVVLTGFVKTSAQPKEPPLPYPPPPSFISIDSKNVEHQIGLLQPYYQERLSALSAAALSNPSTTTPDQGSPADTKLLVVLPDDLPIPIHVKIGPLGQITRGAPGGASKKKAKAKDPAAPAGYVPEAVPLTEPTLSGGLSIASSEPAKPKKSGGGKKLKGEDRLPPVVTASA